jgi:hypothetical protein
MPAHLVRDEELPRSGIDSHQLARRGAYWRYAGERFSARKANLRTRLQKYNSAIDCVERILCKTAEMFLYPGTGMG